MSVAIVCYCSRCDYFIKTAVQLDAVGSHGCAQCDQPMEVYIAQGAREVVQWHEPKGPALRPQDDPRYAPCPECPHWMHFHTAQGCGCGCQVVGTAL